MNQHGQPTVEDLSPSEKLRAQLPAISAILAIIALCLLAYGWWQQDQRDTDRRANDRAQAALIVKLQNTQRAAATAQLKATQARRLSDARFAFSFNKLACTLRLVSDQSISRLEATKPAGYKQAEAFWVRLRDNNVPIPDTPETCSNLPHEPPPGTAPAG